MKNAKYIKLYIPIVILISRCLWFLFTKNDLFYDFLGTIVMFMFCLIITFLPGCLKEN